MTKEKRLQTIDGESLMNLPLRPLRFVVDSLLSQGLHILAGSPKVGKSWLALWLSVAVAKGEPVWGMETQQGTTLYLCLEDTLRRVQERLFTITDEIPGNAFFAVAAKQLEDGLCQQIYEFVCEHSDTVLIIIDTLQMIRSANCDNTYANDYRDLSALKKIADQYGIAILLIHHLRKQGDSDPLNKLSGSTGISGAVDSSFTLVEDKRGSGKATLYCIGRDIEYRELALERSEENIWQLTCDSSVHPGGRIPFLISAFMKERTEYIGTPTEFAKEIDPDGIEGITPKKAGRQITESLAALSKYGITGCVRRSNGKRIIELRRAESVDFPGVGKIVPCDPVAAGEAPA